MRVISLEGPQALHLAGYRQLPFDADLGETSQLAEERLVDPGEAEAGLALNPAAYVGETPSSSSGRPLFEAGVADSVFRVEWCGGARSGHHSRMQPEAR